MDIIKGYIKAHKAGYLLSIALAVIGVILQVISYLLLAETIGQLIAKNLNPDFYTAKCGLILICLAGKEIAKGYSTKVSHNCAFKIMGDIRCDMANKFFTMPLGEVQTRGTGNLKNIMIDQVNNMETLLSHIIPEFTANLLGPILLLGYMCYLDWRLFLASLIPLVIGMYAMKKILGGDYQEKYAGSVEVAKKMNAALIEYINGIEVIKAFNQSDHSYKKYHDAAYENAAYYYNWMGSCMLYSAIGKTLPPMGLIVVLPLGLYFYSTGSLEASVFVTIITLSFATIENLMHVFNLTDEIARVSTIVGGVATILAIPDLTHGTTCLPEDFSPSISLDSVSFSYEEDDEVLHGVTANFIPHAQNAIVGPSGSGKSTIAKLIAGFYECDSGTISIDNIPIESLTQESLSDNIAYVSQDNFLFNISIRQNLLIAKPDATEEELQDALSRAGCDSFIYDLPEGLDTMAGDFGDRLSGGERQRISIARALLKDAPIIVLDEATSYIDPENEGIIQKALANLVESKTLILIAHRLRTITNAENIVVANNGVIDSCGTHTQLLQTSELYQDMWQCAVKGEM